MFDNPLELIKSVAARLSEEVAPPDAIPVDAVLYAEHPNILQLENVAKVIVGMTDNDRTVDEAITTLKHVEDNTARHISGCEACIKAVKMFFRIYPTKEQIQAAGPR